MKRLLRIAAAVIALGAAPAAAAPAMWEVSDADSSVWLFGSVHILPPDLAWRTPLFDERLAAAEQVYFEADIGPLGMIALSFKMAAMMAETANDPWIDRLTDEQRQALKAALAGTQLDLDSASRVPPWAVALTLSAKPMLDAGYDSNSGVDPILQAELPKERKLYFETAVEQIDLLASGTIEEEIELLMASIGQLDGADALLDEMVTAWAEGDPEHIAESMLSDPTMADDVAADKLLYQRNRNWLPVIEGLLSNNDEDLIIVGAAHLAGDGSVIDLLEKAGYTVSRIQ